MRHRHALHAGLLVVAAAVGLCCSPAAPVPPAPPPEPTPVAPPPVAPAPAPAPAPRPAASAAPAPGPDCPADCNGPASAALQSALRARAGGAKACYQRALRAAGVKGSGMVHLTVAHSGVACGVDVELPEDLAPMRSCVRELFAGSSFPAPASGCARVNIPLNFELTDGGT